MNNHHHPSDDAGRNGDQHGTSPSTSTATTTMSVPPNQSTTASNTWAGRVREAQSHHNPADRIASYQSLLSIRSQFLSSNETLEDVATAVLPLIGLEHLLAQTYVDLPHSIQNMDRRLRNLQQACEYWQIFVERLDYWDLLSVEERRQCQEMREASSMIWNDSNSDTTTNGRNRYDWDSAQSQCNYILPPPVSRDVKIARFRAQQAAQKELERLECLRVQQQQQRRRGATTNPKANQDLTDALAVIDDAYDDDDDGDDYDEVDRELALTRLGQIYKLQALDGWMEVLREIPLVQKMIQNSLPSTLLTPPPLSPAAAAAAAASQHGLKVTRITQDPQTGQLHMKREEIRSRVFRPGWNQPTMSLEDFAHREMTQALQREQAQNEADTARLNTPRRYEYLVRDGMEDDADLVDASAPLDRAWDNFKDENPRGSGNKRGDVGDRNF